MHCGSCAVRGRNGAASRCEDNTRPAAPRLRAHRRRERAKSSRKREKVKSERDGPRCAQAQADLDPHILWVTGLVPRHLGAENLRALRSLAPCRLQDGPARVCRIHRNSRPCQLDLRGFGMMFCRVPGCTHALARSARSGAIPVRALCASALRRDLKVTSALPWVRVYVQVGARVHPLVRGRRRDLFVRGRIPGYLGTNAAACVGRSDGQYRRNRAPEGRKAIL